ncbi:MAG TPA: hypothetical protein VGF91_23990 [Solirubrobacteraceae bacterium]|jgi:hypothetical protein
MHSQSVVRAALALAQAGANATDVSKRLGVPRRTMAAWIKGDVPHSAKADSSGQCQQVHEFADLSRGYVYLLGLYLGDGCISKHPRDVYKLRIFLDAKYPGIIQSARDAIAEVKGVAARTLPRPRNCVEVYSFWKCWPCLFPQHGPGKKHERRIELTDWQTTLVDRWPRQLLCGLIHSDGCRFENTGTNWSWPRYGFKQVSADIRTTFREACDRLGLRWTEAPNTVYVSRKADVAVLDEFIGPKR